MIRLNLPKEPYWLTVIPGVTAMVRPVNSVIMGAARATSARLLAEAVRERDEMKQVGASIAHLPDLDNQDVRKAYGDFLLKKSLAQHAIMEWDGVLQKESPEPAAVTAETVGDFMLVPKLCDGFYYEYAKPLIMLDAEKNGSRPAQSGTGDQVAGQPIAPDASKTDLPVPQAGEGLADGSVQTSNTCQ